MKNFKFIVIKLTTHPLITFDYKHVKDFKIENGFLSFLGTDTYSGRVTSYFNTSTIEKITCEPEGENEKEN